MKPLATILILFSISYTTLASTLTTFEVYSDWDNNKNQPFVLKITSDQHVITNVKIETTDSVVLLEIKEDVLKLPSSKYTYEIDSVDSDEEKTMILEIHKLTASIQHYYNGYMDSPIEFGSEYSLFLEWKVDFEGSIYGNEIYLANQEAGEMSISGLLRFASKKEI
ncbi:MAG: hypothetical protein ISR65_11270 [Bacteriovoracaceae bacterium]|nr:hypothetical protein [Bacteriovoracaceae bacterium]